MLPVTKKWLFLKISSLILLPLMFWFIINLVNFYDKTYQEIVGFLTSQPSKFLIGLFLVFAYFFSAISTELSAAPLSKLSETIHKFNVFFDVLSSLILDI